MLSQYWVVNTVCVPDRNVNVFHKLFFSSGLFPFSQASFSSCATFWVSYAVNVLLYGDVVCDMTSINVTMRMSVFLDLTLCHWVNRSQHFERS